MPIYEYECGKCGHEFELEQRITEDPVKTCPKCRARKVKRLISQTSFVLKGGGWYSDLYSSPGKSDKDKDAGAKEKGDAAAAGKSEKSDKPNKADKPGKNEKKKSGGDAKPKGRSSRAAA
jgi:putative FmdB family regulatory protein